MAAIRERHGYTQAQCADIIGCSERTWQRYEASGRMPRADWWCFLLRIGEVTLGQLPPIPPRSRGGIMIGLKP